MEARKAYFMVRAEVPNESDRAKFDQWYGTHHLPLAMDKFHAEKVWRFWSRSDASVHYALYQFKNMATLRDRLDSSDFKLLIADFDQATRLDPKFAYAYMNRGLAYGRKGECDRALADLDQAIRLDPKLSMAYSNRLRLQTSRCREIT